MESLSTSTPEIKAVDTPPSFCTEVSGGIERQERSFDHQTKDPAAAALVFKSPDSFTLEAPSAHQTRAGGEPRRRAGSKRRAPVKEREREVVGGGVTVVVHPPRKTSKESAGSPGEQRVRLQLPEGAGEQHQDAASGAQPTPATRRNRVRGMSAVKKFEQEYVTSDFLQDLNEKPSMPKPGKKVMPSVVELFSQVSNLKEESLALKKAEAELSLERDDLEHQLKSLKWYMEQVDQKSRAELIWSESAMRDCIEQACSDIRSNLAILMHQTEPERREEEPTAGALAVHLAGQNSSLSQSLDEAHEELRVARVRLDEEVEERVRQEGELAQHAAQRAAHVASVSRLETSLLRQEAENRRLRTEVEELRQVAESIEVDKKRLAEAHRRLAEAEARALHDAAASRAALEAYERQAAPPRHTYQVTGSNRTTARKASGASPTGSSPRSPRYNKHSLAGSPRSGMARYSISA